MKHLPFYIFILLFSFFLLFKPPQVFSQQGSSTVTATVGQLHLDISGIAAPYATIVLASKEVFLQSAVADQYGSFYIQPVLIKSGFSDFCLTAIDIKRLGESLTCIKVPPASSDVIMNNIFLPPSLGLYRNQITAGGTVLMFGYSMPDAVVSVSLNKLKIYSVHTEENGYYEIRIPNAQSGSYVLSATAVRAKRLSLEPTKKVGLTVLTPAQQVEKGTKKIIGLVAAEIWIILFLVIFIVVMLFLLMRKRLSSSNPVKPKTEGTKFIREK